MEFKNKIKQLRQDAGMTQDELAQKLLVTRKQISKWETGVSLPTSEMMLKLSEIFKVKLEYLMDNNVTDTNNSNQNADGVDIDSIKPRNWLLIILIILAILISMCLIYGIVQNKKNNNARGTTIFDKINSSLKSSSDFNRGLEWYGKNTYGVAITNLLNEVIKSNEKYSTKQIEVTFGDVTTSVISEIREIKNKIDGSLPYNIELKYDENNYINQVIITEDHSDHVSVSSYNIFIESHAGVSYGINVGNLLTSILENNNKYNRQIVVVFNNVELNGNEAIKEKRKALANDYNSKYDVDFKYDSEGYIVKAIIEKI